MSTVMPQVPPRPNRTSDKDFPSSLGSDIPKIPPRPANRRLDRSVSPHRFASSPLNETPFSTSSHGKSSLYASDNGNLSASDLPRRPPSVTLPSIGQEGSEYADIVSQEDVSGTSPTTRNIANDLKLHAPKPSLPVQSAKARVSAVTRTDSGQAAAFGIGKASSVTDDKAPESRSLKSKPSFASQSSDKYERPASGMDEEHGIPEIGQRVPMYPNAGDVQAPSPAPFAQIYEKGVGFHNDGSKPRHHGRKHSARGHDIPPDAYGRYGHGVVPHDRFEKQYYEKHPELFKKELGQYGEGRPEWAMSSEDLNKIVRDTASRGGAISTPTEDIGFQASEEYASRMSSPKPFGIHGNTSETHVDSPLKDSFTADSAKSKDGISRSLHAPSDLTLGGSEAEDDVIHVDQPGRRSSKVYGGSGHAESTEDLGPHSGAEEAHDEHGYGAPILASDEVAKEPFGWELQPAVSPSNERKNYEDIHRRASSASSQNGSRPSSRPGSIHGVPGMRHPDSTPLEDLDEYEPLFPEEKNGGSEKPLTAADRLKQRPELKNRKFPSQDIWEDTPNSLQYTATVSTPQLPEEKEEKIPRDDETPAQAFARRQEELAEEESKNKSFLHEEKKTWANRPDLASDLRPGMKQRFPSRDIWEDTPDSLQLQTTVAGPQSDEEKDVLSPPEERPTTGAVMYHQEKAAAGIPLSSEEGRATTGLAAVLKPSVPARPKSKLSSSPEKAEPVIPERPSKLSKQISPVDNSPFVPTKTKPAVPARPAKPLNRGDSGENVPLAKVTSNSSAKSVGSDSSSAAAAAAVKTKPPVPSRPMGSKIAALQGGFMSDLNKRLRLGPQAPKKEEEVKDEPAEEKEKAPLVDARKGRARGPQRRAPAKSASPSPAAALAVPEEKPQQRFSCSIHSCIYAIDPESEHGELVVPNKEPAELTENSPLETKKSEPEEPAVEHHETLPPSTQEESKGVEQEVAQHDAPETEHIEVTGAHVEHVEDVADVADEAGAEEKGGEDLAASTATLKPEIAPAAAESEKESEAVKEEEKEE